MRRTFALMTIVAIAIGAGVGADHPDSAHQPLADGCNRSQLLLLGDSVVNLVHRSTMEVAPEWVYVGAGDVRTIRTLEGRVLASHTAGQDLFGSHQTYDLNVDVAVDRRYSGLLSTRNERERTPQIHTEWESGNVPTWSWPSPGDRVRETGSWAWDCGHWQEGARKVPESDRLPGDPLGELGIEGVGGEEAEIHPISELATWRTLRGFVPPHAHRPVPVSQLDVYISNQGGGAKATEECALSPADPGAAARRIAEHGGCSDLQDVTGREYTYVVKAPPRPAHGARLRWRRVQRSSHHASDASVRASTDRITITVPFSRVKPSTGVQDFGATYQVWWTTSTIVTHRFRVSPDRLTIFNNLDVDAGSEQQNPEVALVSPNGEWNMYLDVAGRWRTLHDEMARNKLGNLDDIPSASPGHPRVYQLTKLPPTEVALTSGSAFHLLADARDCDLPGFVDCPADQELDFAQHPGRSEIAVPVAKLVGASTTFTVHAPICAPNVGCPEESSDPACHGPCYAVTFTVTDMDAVSLRTHTIAGDGTRTGTTFDGVKALSLDWWTDPPTKPSLDQNEEAGFIRRATEDLLAGDPKHG